MPLLLVCEAHPVLLVHSESFPVIPSDREDTPLTSTAQPKRDRGLEWLSGPRRPELASAPGLVEGEDRRGYEDRAVGSGYDADKKGEGKVA